MSGDGWSVRESVDDNGSVEWFVWDDEDCPRVWFPTQDQAEGWLDLQRAASEVVAGE